MTERLSVRLQRELELAGFQLAKVRYAYEAGSAQIEVGEMKKKKTSDKRKERAVNGGNGIVKTTFNKLFMPIFTFRLAASTSSPGPITK